MSTSEIIEEIKRLPKKDALKIFGWMQTEFDELDALLAELDSDPNIIRMSEDEILALPRRDDPTGQ